MKNKNKILSYLDEEILYMTEELEALKKFTPQHPENHYDNVKERLDWFKRWKGHVERGYIR